MTTELLATRASPSAMRTWKLELDAELPPAAHDVTPERTRAVTDLLARIPGVDVVAVRPHCRNRFVLASLTVEARDLSDAVDRAVAYLRSSAVAAGIGPLILVGSRFPR
jgi:hypothetical protein